MSDNVRKPGQKDPMEPAKNAPIGGETTTRDAPRGVSVGREAPAISREGEARDEPRDEGGVWEGVKRTAQEVKEALSLEGDVSKAEALAIARHVS